MAETHLDHVINGSSASPLSPSLSISHWGNCPSPSLFRGFSQIISLLVFNSSTFWSHLFIFFPSSSSIFTFFVLIAAYVTARIAVYGGSSRRIRSLPARFISFSLSLRGCCLVLLVVCVFAVACALLLHSLSHCFLPGLAHLASGQLLLSPFTNAHCKIAKSAHSVVVSP